MSLRVLFLLGVIVLAAEAEIIQFPGGDGEMHTVDLSEKPDQRVLLEVQRNPANNLYLLFTRENPTTPQTLVMNNEASIRQSNFNPHRQTVVVVHGWLGNQYTNINPDIRNAYLETRDVNVIVMDWHRLANSGYVTAATGVPNVGRGLGQFLDFLSRATGAALADMHLVGFSLGAHLVGNAGRELRGRVARITGLDPAGPLWYYNSNRLSAADAVYVEAIHTNGGGFGLGSRVAHADFYPNGGSNQPGCLMSWCDHNRAWELFAASVRYDHLVGNRCNNNLQVAFNNCRGDELPMGNADLRKTGSGMYRANTARRYPF